MSLDIRLDRTPGMSGIPSVLRLLAEAHDVKAQQVELHFAFPKDADLKALRLEWMATYQPCLVETDTYRMEGILMRWHESLWPEADGTLRLDVMIQGKLTLKGEVAA
jgi:hypothetical protein